MKNTIEICESTVIIQISTESQEKKYEFAKDQDFYFVDDSHQKIVLRHGTINNMADDLKISVSAPQILSSYGRNHYVLMCTAQYNDRTEYGIGESNIENLESKIAKEYPFVTAYTRAYDKAVLNVLGFSGKIYSDSEIAKNSNESEPEVPKVSVPEPPKFDETKTQTEKKETPGTHKEENKAKTSENAFVPTDDRYGEKKYGDELNPDTFIVTSGRYKGKNMTVAEMYQQDKSSCEWFANKNLTNSEEFNKHIFACRREMKKHAS